MIEEMIQNNVLQQEIDKILMEFQYTYYKLYIILLNCLKIYAETDLLEYLNFLHHQSLSMYNFLMV